MKWIDVSNMTPGEACRYAKEKAKELGEPVRFRYGGHEFHSDTVTEDIIYLTTYGMNKEQHDKAIAKELYNAKIEAMKMDEKKPGFIKRGLELVYFERFPQWEECVDNFSNNKYGGNPIEIALEIMEALNRGERVAVAAKMINSNNKKLNKLVEDIVFRYSKKGPDFKEYMLGENMTADDMIKIEQMKKMNTRLRREDWERNRYGN